VPGPEVLPAGGQRSAGRLHAVTIIRGVEPGQAAYDLESSSPRVRLCNACRKPPLPAPLPERSWDLFGVPRARPRAALLLSRVCQGSVARRSSARRREALVSAVRDHWAKCEAMVPRPRGSDQGSPGRRRATAFVRRGRSERLLDRPGDPPTAAPSTRPAPFSSGCSAAATTRPEAATKSLEAAGGGFRG
jgi:hypothetical protein